MKKILVRMSSLLVLVILSACGTTQEKKEVELNKQVKMQAPADTPNQIMERAAIAFASAEGLSAEQKMLLRDVYIRVYTESMRIRREIGQSKSLLFRTLAKVDYKAADIKSLKKKIVDLDQKRLDLMFGALDEVQAVVGKGVDASKIYKHFEDYEIPNRRLNDYQF